MSPVPALVSVLGDVKVSPSAALLNMLKVGSPTAALPPPDHEKAMSGLAIEGPVPADPNWEDVYP